MKKVLAFVMAAALAFSGASYAAEEEIPAKSLAELLELVKDGKVVNGRINDQREKEFLADKVYFRRPEVEVDPESEED